MEKTHERSMDPSEYFRDYSKYQIKKKCYWWHESKRVRWLLCCSALLRLKKYVNYPSSIALLFASDPQDAFMSLPLLLLNRERKPAS